MRILITGASGLLGVSVALEASRGALGQDDLIYGVVNSHRIAAGVAPSGNPLHTNALHIIQADLLIPGELERLVETTEPDWVINCAALAVVDACEENPDLARKINVEMPAKLAALVARGGARLVHVSTDAVFDGLRGNYSEADEPNPQMEYARTKLAGERAVLEANPEAIVARVNLFGWSLSGTRSLAEWFFNNLTAGRSMMGFTDVIFCPLLVNHLAQVFFEMLKLRLSGLYHVFSPLPASKYEFGVAIAEKFGLDASLIHPTRVAEGGLKVVRSPNLTMRVDKLNRALGAPPPTWRDGLERFYQLYVEEYPKKLVQEGHEGR